MTTYVEPKRRSSKRPPTRFAAVLVLLAAPAALFGAGCQGGSFDPRVDAEDKRRATEARSGLPIGADVEVSPLPSQAIPTPERP